MLTNEQLTHIETRIVQIAECLGEYELQRVAVDLLREVKQLTTHNRVMQGVLAQFSDGVNWSTAPSVRYVQNGEWPSSIDHPVYIWHCATNPQHLAEVALLGDGEVNTTVQR